MIACPHWDLLATGAARLYRDWGPRSAPMMNVLEAECSWARAIRFSARALKTTTTTTHCIASTTLTAIPVSRLTCGAVVSALAE